MRHNDDSRATRLVPLADLFSARGAIAAAVLVLTSTLLPAPPASADDVYLTNGRVFEDVVARTEGERVAIRMAHGLIRIPAVRVARIERAETPLAEYLRRLATLESQPEGGGAADWIALARWARDHGLASAYRQAATVAAALDPRAEGLAPLMRDLDLFFDESAERWMGETELMGRRGLVRYEGAWVTPEQRSAAQARLTEAEARRLEARGEAQRDQALVELASAVRAQAEANAAEERRRDPFDTSLPFAYYSPGWWVVPVPGHGHDRGDDRGGHDDGTPPPVQHTRPANGGGFRASDWIPGKLNPGAAPPPGRISATARSATRR